MNKLNVLISMLTSNPSQTIPESKNSLPHFHVSHYKASFPVKCASVGHKWKVRSYPWPGQGAEAAVCFLLCRNLELMRSWFSESWVFQASSYHTEFAGTQPLLKGRQVMNSFCGGDTCPDVKQCTKPAAGLPMCPLYCSTISLTAKKI